LVAVLLTGCSSFHSSFRKQFRVGFIKSCMAGPGMTTSYCGCVADSFSGHLNDTELIRVATDPAERDEMQAGLQAAAGKCRDKFGR
jgi:hypothetical protein